MRWNSKMGDWEQASSELGNKRVRREKLPGYRLNERW